ncbi:HD-GYP domain-containing protein [Fundidesulfovibrio terrae]|uniref:HD-GYP domain-containing protein n=1 Tax=Fundidesulfovibrio terrae TaxID=2922866 RepID=UPI001FAFE33B|nr:HD-GYP domain-containing protein [Fundidesulfovibrio terrae]
MLKEIPLSQLVVGMFVECYGDGSFHNPFHHVRDYVHSKARIDEFKALSVTSVTIDDAKSKKSCTPLSPGAAEPPFSFQGPSAARKVYALCLSHVMDVMHKVRQGLDVDFTQSFEAVDILMNGVEENPTHMNLLAKLHHYDDYTFRHSLNVSLLSLIFGRHLGMDQDGLRRLAFAGLYHDVGKFRIPLEILNKPGRLSEKEFEVMKHHSRIGYELLKGQPEIPEDVLHGVLHHHERYDGQGYPRQLKADEKDSFSRILTIVDIFDALTSDRAYKKAYTPHESLKAMFSWRNESFHPGLLEKFVECFGVYPASSFVRLSDQTYGVVVESRPASPSRPLVKVVFTKKLVPQLPVYVDLAATPKAADGGLDIEACLDPRTLGITIERFL